jgi:hypothetical protein
MAAFAASPPSRNDSHTQSRWPAPRPRTSPHLTLAPACRRARSPIAAIPRLAGQSRPDMGRVHEFEFGPSYLPIIGEIGCCHTSTTASR